jgi:O-antigen/teichoic acid export membrane protein
MTDRLSQSAFSVGAGAGVAAVSGIVVLAIAARTLTTEQNSGFLTFWAGLFAVFAVLSGIQNEITRSVRADSRLDLDVPRRTSPLLSALIVGIGAGAVILLLYPAWNMSFATLKDPVLPMLLIAGAAVLYSGHVATVGVFAGLGRWPLFGTLTAGESLVRLLFTGLTAVLAWSVSGFEWAAVSGTLTWLVASIAFPGFRITWKIRISLARKALIGRLLNAMAASGANAVLVTGFPLLMSLTTDPETYASAAPLVVAVSMTRAPLLIPLTAFQSMVIAAFVEHPQRAGAVLRRLILVVVAVALAGGLLAALIGPTLMSLVFGTAYANTPFALGLLVVGASFLALLILGGSVALALDAHTVNTLGWYVALLVSVAVMLTPLDLTTRTVLSLTLGPLVGSIVHLSYVSRRLGSRSQESR